MKHSIKPKKVEGKEEGRSLGWCLARAKLYSRDVKGVGPYLYVIPLALAWLVCDLAFRIYYKDVGVVDYSYLPANLFTAGWILLMVGIVFALPNSIKFPFRCIPLMFCMACMETHCGFYNVFNKFFSLSILSYASGAKNLITRDYIHIDGPIIGIAVATIVLMMCSGRLLQVIPPRTTKASVAVGLAAVIAGTGLIGYTAHRYFPVMDTVIWATTDEEDVNNATYQSFTDSTNCMMLSGLYQYTARDVWALIKPKDTMSESAKRQVEEYIQEYEAEETDNAYTGLLKGKNVIMVQLEAMDTWLIDPDYMPTLARLKEEGLSFSNHYTPAFISAGTFNTEFMVNTSLLPAASGTPISVYSENDFPYSIANLFEKAGYTANSFHNSRGSVYDRENVHPNLGYRKYHGGPELDMPNYQMDRNLILGFDKMVSDDHPFFSFVITYSVHGPYGTHNLIYQENAEQARAKAKRTDGNFVFAVAGAMETERFVEALMDKLEESGHLDDTVLVFYADHYDYYMQDDGLQMEIKGVPNMDLLQHTDFFLWSPELKAEKVEKVTSSLDVLPTLANLFGLDTTGAFLAGHDGLGDQGGYVFFADGNWYDGETYWDSNSEDEKNLEMQRVINRVTSLSNQIMAGNYYANRDE